MRVRAGRVTLAVIGLLAAVGLAIALVHAPGRAASAPAPASEAGVPVQV